MALSWTLSVNARANYTSYPGAFTHTFSIETLKAKTTFTISTTNKLIKNTSTNLAVIPETTPYISTLVNTEPLFTDFGEATIRLKTALGAPTIDTSQP